LYRPVFLTPGGSRGIGVDMLYDALLPSLNARPFVNNIIPQRLRWQRLPISGDFSCGWCAPSVPLPCEGLGSRTYGEANRRSSDAGEGCG
jgi:hypothetical protein